MERDWTARRAECTARKEAETVMSHWWELTGPEGHRPQSLHTHSYYTHRCSQGCQSDHQLTDNRSTEQEHVIRLRISFYAGWLTEFHYQLWRTSYHTHTHTHQFNGSLYGTTRVSQYQKSKTNLDFTEARDSEWQWHPLGKSAPRSRQITMPAPHHSVFYRPDALPAAQATASKQWRQEPGPVISYRKKLLSVLICSNTSTLPFTKQSVH